ncbi:MAG: SAM-dependent DNA methyltransferase [Lachnospiraceae bacterium]|nr:SAM-dependent DNA methyltransferase [Lachnospiraceae bacterium]
MATKNTADIGFEKEIWDAACVLRGNMDASEYKNVILGLIFLKYISDSFDEKYQELKDEGEGFEEDKDEYYSENIFYVPAGARWKDIAAVSHKEEIGTVIDKAMIAIESENKKLKGILPKNFARQELDKRRLGEVVDLFTNIKMTDGADEKDLLGRTYEYCLRNFAEQEGKNAGQFYTPSCVVRTIVEILQPFNGRVYDPCCGAGGMFVQSAEFIKHHQGLINDISVYGQESNPTTWKMAKMNLAIRGIDCNLGEFPEDTFLSDQHPTMRADYVMANPPFNLSSWGADKLKEDQRWKYGTPPAGNANYAWIQHMIWHLAPNGKMGMVLANGSLSSQSGGEGEIRKNIIEEDLVECIISLPSQLFYTTGIPVCLWFLSKNKKQKGKTLFIDARKMGTMVTRALRELTDGSDDPEKNDIGKLAATYNAFVAGTLEDVPGFCAVVTTEKIAEQDYILTPGRYVGIEEQEDDGEPFEEKMARLTTELYDLFKESHKLENEIKKKLAAIGYGE